ncbi:hypothetical protein AVEN_5175-1 [Araneus ventricosus]|uniref:Reverse transcriptase domain-containing protein n=1 Tax=Araneus ventricosus TaxID=182803 RepID=A0A4Y2HSS3_ARAVE|nr:hypothetical protein AVEN_5175-1 [Araneus ventricosus]
MLALRWIRFMEIMSTLELYIQYLEEVPQASVRSPILFSFFLSGIEQVNGRSEIGSFADDIVLWRSGSDFKKLESDVNQALIDL